MGIKVSVDRDKCEGYGNCVLATEKFFDLDDEGTVVLLQADADEADLAALKRAVYDCPTEAITVDEDA